MVFGIALGFGLSAPAWLALLDYVQGSGREAQASTAHQQWMVPVAAWPALILPCWTVKWADFATRMMPHAGTELACGLAAPCLLLGGLVARGRAFVRQTKWELLLLLVVGLLAMMPTAGVFRWSFRWLPLFHLILALCAAEAFREGLTGFRPGLIALFLVGVITVAMSTLSATGRYAFPLAWIFLGLSAFWAAIEMFARANVRLQQWIPATVTFVALLTTYFCIPSNCGVPKYNLAGPARSRAVVFELLSGRGDLFSSRSQGRSGCANR
jgi:hypothetical protein